jgi:hypothetical protein
MDLWLTLRTWEPPKDSLIVALACRSAAGLGPVAIASGVRAYWGWSDALILVLPDNPFQTVVEPALTSLLLGDTVGDAFGRLRDSWERLERQYEPTQRKASKPFAPIVWLSAIVNRLSMVLLGDPATRL